MPPSSSHSQPEPSPDRAAGPPRPAGLSESALNAFETVLWQSRLLTLVAVVSSLTLWLVMLFITTVDAVYLVGQVLGYADASLSPDARTALRAQLIGSVIGIVDGYLIAAALFIFTLGLYRQFISRLEVAEASEVSSRILDVGSFEDLKGRLARVIVLILIVKALQLALSLTYTTVFDLLLLALSILLVGGSIYLSKGGSKAEARERTREEREERV